MRIGIDIYNCIYNFDDTSYELTTNNHKIAVVNYLNVDKIYRDLFEKLGENE